ncbi:MAG: GNAT family N-acetyltransferase [Candidatus Binatia bacterium]
MHSAPVSAEEFGEKEFYLDEFHARTLCIAVPLEECDQPGGFEALGGVLRDLIANETRVIALIGVPASRDLGAELKRVRGRLQRRVLAGDAARRFPLVNGRRSAAESFTDLSLALTEQPADTALTAAWVILRNRPLLVGVIEEDRLVDVARLIAGRLRVHKLVVVQPEAGVRAPGGAPISFMDDDSLAAMLQPGEAEWAGLAERRATFDAVRAALRAGVRSVNLCALDGLAHELFTYEGSGTLFTLADYCRIERLGIDDFEEVERLIARGQRDGFLKPRSSAEVARILLSGFGAEIGAHHFAGVCGLEVEAYRAEHVGEIVGLYTITRFKGEGVGGRLIARALDEARALGLHYVFACTLDPRAEAFFTRHGFRRVTPADVPAPKWVGYDCQRKARIRVLRHDLAPANAAVAGRDVRAR